MLELIDRAKVLAKIYEFQSKFNETGDSHERVAYASAEHCMLVIKASPAVNRWIPVEDALPEQGERVIVAIFGSDMIMPNESETLQDAIERSRKEGYITVGFIGSDGWYGADWFPLMVKPTYWMPMPTAPEAPEEYWNVNPKPPEKE